MKTLFYITTSTDINFAIILAREYAKLNNSEVFAFTHTSLMKKEIISKTSIFSDVISEFDTTPEELPIINKDRTKIEEERALVYEQKTNNNIWKFIYQDRWLSMRRRGFLYKEGTKYSRNELLKTVNRKFYGTEKFLIKNNIGKVFFVTQDYGTGSATILYEVSKYLGIAIYCPTISKFGNYFFLNNTIYGKVDKLENKFFSYISEFKTETVLNSVEDIYNDILTEKKTAYSVPKQKSKHLIIIINKLKSLINFYTEKSYKDPKLSSPILHYFDKIYIKLNKYFLKAAFRHDEFEEEEKYVYFPLHLEPELVLLLHSPYYSDQINIIRNIAKSLPANVSLVLKDHPIAFGRRNYSFYQKLKRIPNTKLIKPEIKSSKIIKNSIAIATITGTTGIEAFYHKKPTITFGDVFYNFLPNIIKIKNMDILPEIWGDIEQSAPKENDILKYIHSIHETAYNINLLKFVQDLSDLNREEMATYKSEEISNYAKYLYTL